MDKNCVVTVMNLKGEELLSRVRGTLDHFSAAIDNKPAEFSVKLNDIEYPSLHVMWVEVQIGNAVVQAQVRVEYISKICSTYTKLKAIRGTIHTYDIRYNGIPCGPNCWMEHKRSTAS